MVSTLGTVRSRVDRWEVHNLAAGFLRTAITVVPLPLSAFAGVAAGWEIGGSTPIDIVGRVIAAGLVSVATFVIVEWLARRLLPLAVLLRLSLVFPDRAPSRFAVALRSTSVRRLREWARSNQDRLDEQALAEKVLTLASALNFHDRRTRGHSERTRALAELVIEELGLSETEANEVRWGAFLHDIGKLLVPSAILNKPGEPSASEWEQLRQHPAEGGRLVAPLRPFIGAGVDAVSSHHESFDGSGYPDGLRGQEIALAARIVSVVDSFEVMTAVRSYKRPMSANAARQELVRQSGGQFDPRVVRAFVNVSLGRLHWALGLVAWAAELPFVGVVPRAAAQVGATVGASGSAVSTATLAGVATVSLGATLAVTPLSAPLPAAASSPAPGAVAAATASVPTGADPGGVQAASGGAAPGAVSAASTNDGTSSRGPATASTGSAGANGARSGSAGSGAEPGGDHSGQTSTTGATSTSTSGDGAGTAVSAHDPATSTAPGTQGTTGTTGGTTTAAGSVPIVSTVLSDVGGTVAAAGGAVSGAVGSTVGSVGGAVDGAVGDVETALGLLGKLGGSTSTTSSTGHKSGSGLLGL